MQKKEPKPKAQTKRNATQLRPASPIKVIKKRREPVQLLLPFMLEEPAGGERGTW